MSFLRVHVKPRSHKDALLACDEAGLLSVSVTAAPADGAANKAVEALIASALDVAKSRVKVVRGATARTKTVEISSLSDEETRDRVLAALSGR